VISILEADGLVYRYGAREVVRGVQLEVRPGDIFGFIGPNGAGKTTTIKMLLGLLRPASGVLRVFGLSMRERRVEILRRIGSLVEAPAIYPHLTAAENLGVQALVHNVPSTRVDEVLEIVGLQADAARKVKHFSLGMKQRLGIAMALLHRPELLVLDEPANGLDPAGILELRALFKRLAGDGVTMFVSSHILAELEQTITRLAIINRGAVCYQGGLDELRRAHGASLRIRVGSLDSAAPDLARRGFVSVPGEDGALRMAVSGPGEAAAINRFLVECGHEVSELMIEQPNLEQVYMRLTRDEPTPRPAAGVEEGVIPRPTGFGIRDSGFEKTGAIQWITDEAGEGSS
jgi:ABC-2 type transport system ATP-binding protein